MIEATKTAILAVREAENPTKNRRPVHTVQVHQYSDIKYLVGRYKISIMNERVSKVK